MLTAELRINGLLVAVVEVQQQPPFTIGGEGEPFGGIANYRTRLFDIRSGEVLQGQIQGYARARGPVALVHEALTALAP